MPIRVKTYPLDQWAPDLGDLGEGHLTVCQHVLPVDGGWVPDPEVIATTGLPSQVLGAHVHESNGASTLYVGTATGLYRVDAPNALDMTRESEPYASTSWDFASYGDAVIAVAPEEPPQILRSGGFRFEDGPNPDYEQPHARFVEILGNRAVLGVISNTSYAEEVDTSMLALSATDDISVFGTPEKPKGKRSGNVPVNDDAGGITGLSGGMDFGYVFKRERIYIMRPNSTWGIDLGTAISYTHGTSHPRSIVRVGTDVYFWSARGPAVVRAGRGVEELAVGRLWRTIAETAWPATEPDLTYGNPFEVLGAWDEMSSTVNWFYKAESGIVQVIFEPTTSRFSVCGRQVLEGRGDLGELAFVVGREPNEVPLHMFAGLQVGIGSTLLGWAGGFEVPARWVGRPTFSTPFFELEDGRQVVVNGIRLRYQLTEGGQAPSVAVRVRSRMYEGAEIYTHESSSETPGAVNDHGFIQLDQRSEARQHEITVSLDQVDDVLSIAPTLEIRYSVGGRA